MSIARASILRLLTAAALGLCLAPAAFAEADAKGDEFFTSKVWPLIDANCTSCHGAEKQKGKLRLDSKAAWLKGWEDGEIVVPGNPDKSLVIASINHAAKDPDQNMPPKKKKQLTKDEIAVFAEWIKMGMPWPEKK